MTETLMSWSVIPRLLTVTVFAALYSRGGRNNKWIRRYLASSLFILAMVGMSLLFDTFHAPMLFAAPLLILALVMPYSSPWQRVATGVVFGLYGLITGILLGNWILGLAQGALAFISAIFLGLVNPVLAPKEEALIGGLSVILIPFMI